jgi:hypothetical protein
MHNDIKDWVTRISTPTDLLGGLSVCPYAKGTEYELISTDGSDINPPPWDFELIVYVLPQDYSVSDLFEIASEYNKQYPELVFLPDHKDRYTEINGIQTNNGKYNILLCQWRDNLNKAREKLQTSKYYTYWTTEYLEEILNT